MGGIAQQMKADGDESLCAAEIFSVEWQGRLKQ